METLIVRKICRMKKIALVSEAAKFKLIVYLIFSYARLELKFVVEKDPEKVGIGFQCSPEFTTQIGLKLY